MNKGTKDIILCALLAGLIAVCSQIQIPLPYVPINAALLAVHMTGILLKPKYAALTILVYIGLGFIGLPVFANFTGGAQILFGPTGGFILGYLLDAIIISVSMMKFKNSMKTILIYATIGTLACYTLGTLWFMNVTQMSVGASLVYCVYPFIPGDILKIILAVLISKRLKLINN